MLIKNKFMLAGIMAGIGIMFFASMRYFVLFPDLDKALMYNVTGLLTIAVSWLYYRSCKLSDTLYSVEEYLADNKIGGAEREVLINEK